MYNKNIKIQVLVEEYFGNTEQMNAQLADAAKQQAKYEKEYPKKYGELKSMLGASLLKKFEELGSTGTFAPVPLSAMDFTEDDFEKFKKANGWNGDIEKFTFKMAESLGRSDFRILGGKLVTDHVFATLGKMADFADAFVNAAKMLAGKTVHAEEIKWTPIRKKFAEYFK